MPSKLDKLATHLGPGSWGGGQPEYDNLWAPFWEATVTASRYFSRHAGIRRTGGNLTVFVVPRAWGLSRTASLSSLYGSITNHAPNINDEVCGIEQRGSREARWNVSMRCFCCVCIRHHYTARRARVKTRVVASTNMQRKPLLDCRYPHTIIF